MQCDAQMPRTKVTAELTFVQKYAGLSLRARGRGFPPARMNMIPGYFYSKIEPQELLQKSTLKRK